jgi:hypothetical protein
MERSKWWTLLAVSVATFMLLLDITVVNVALPSIRTDLGAGFTDLQWVVDAYVLTLAALVLRAAAGVGAVWRGGGAGGAGRGRHPAVPAGRRLGVWLRPGPDARRAVPGGRTTSSGPVADRAALRGLPAKSATRAVSCRRCAAPTDDRQGGHAMQHPPIPRREAATPRRRQLRVARRQRRRPRSPIDRRSPSGRLLPC